MHNPTTGYPAPGHGYVQTMRRRVLRELSYLVLTCILAVAGIWLVVSTYRAVPR